MSKKSKELNKITKDYIKKGASNISEEDIEKVTKKADEIEQKVQTAGPLQRFIKDVKLMLSIVKDYWNKDYREIPWWALSSIVFALLYVLSPVDLIPDFIPVVGYLDDAAVVSLCLLLIESELHKYEQWKNMQAAA